MRRRSILGPLILIAIGGLFLVNNLYPELPMLEMVARYWPYLLIGWGVLRLAEVLFWAGRGRGTPMAGVSGGEWTLIVLLCLFGSGLFFGYQYRNRWPGGRITMRGLEVFGEAYEYPVAGQKQVGRTPRIVVDNQFGNARIVGSDVEELKVSGRKTIRAFSQSDADAASKQTSLEIVTQGDQIVVRTNQDRSENKRASADLEISVPKGASIECRGRRGDFDVSDIIGGVEVNSDNAGVRLQNIGGNARVELNRSDIIRAVNVKGNVDLKGRGQDVELDNIEGVVTLNGNYSGELQFRNLAKPLRFQSSQTELRVERLPGSIRMALGNISGTNMIGPIRMHTKSKDVQFKDFTQSMDIDIERGDIELRPSKTQMGKVDVRTRTGDIDLALAPGAKFEIHATTRRGEAQNEYGSPITADSTDHGATLRGSTGGPGIALNTERGTITVRKATGESAETEPDGTTLLPKAPKPPKDIPPPPVPPKKVE